MHFFQKALVGSWVYEDKRISDSETSTRGIKAHAREIRHGNFSAKSGIVTPETMITFRSRSARIIWLVQLSCEMWEYTSMFCICSSIMMRDVLSTSQCSHFLISVFTLLRPV